MSDTEDVNVQVAELQMAERDYVTAESALGGALAAPEVEPSMPEVQRHIHAVGQTRALGMARNRLMASDGQRLSSAAEPVVAAEGPAAAGRDDVKAGCRHH